MTTPASQRTTELSNVTVVMNVRYNGKQYMLYYTTTDVYLANMNPDGSGWSTVWIMARGSFGSFYGDIHDNKLFLIVKTSSNYLTYLIKCNLDGTSLTQVQVAIANYPQKGFFFDFDSNKIYFYWASTINYTDIYLATTDLNGGNLVSSIVGTLYMVYSILVNKCGSGLVYFLNSEDYCLWSAVSDLDGGNFTLGLEPIDEYVTSGMATLSNSTHAYVFYVKYEEIYYPVSHRKVGRINADGSGFYSVDDASVNYNGTSADRCIGEDNNLYGTVTNSGKIVLHKFDLGLSNFTEIIYQTTNATTVNYRIYVNSDGSIIYTFTQRDGSNVLQLWTDPGGTIDPPEPVNNASQRTWGKEVNAVLLNKEYDGKRYVVWIVGSTGTIWLGKSDIDGTNWVPKIVTTLIYTIERYPRVCHIYNDDIIIVASATDVDSSRKTVVIKFDLSGENLTYNTVMYYAATRIYLEDSGMRYARIITGGYMMVGTSDFYGNGYSENQVTARTFTSAYYEVARAGNKLLYFYRSVTALYVAQSDLDCTNFVQRSTGKSFLGMAYAVSDGSYVYTTYYTQTVFSIAKVSTVTTLSSDFAFIDTSNDSFGIYELFKDGSYLYLIAAGQDNDGLNTIDVGKCDLGLSSYTEENFIVGDFFDDTKVDVGGEYYKYAWSQEHLYNNGNIVLYHLWTYPGHGTITPITTQCQVTDILTDATTGKTITPLLGGV